MQEHLFRNFSTLGNNGFLNDVSITFMTTEILQMLLNEVIGTELSKPWHLLELILKVVFDQL